jgi:uncharacterized protein
VLGKVSVVRGNCDRGIWASALPDHEVVTIAGQSIYVVHDLGQITVDPKAAGIAAVVCGHTHQPKSEVLDGVLYFNPGSAGPRRYGRPVSLGKLHVGPDGVRGEIILLADNGR